MTQLFLDFYIFFGTLTSMKTNQRLKLTFKRWILSPWSDNLTRFLIGRVTIGKALFNPNWHEGWYFYILVLFGSYFVSCFVFKDFQTLLEVKMYSNRVDLKSCWANWVFKKLNLGGANDEHFSCFQSSWGFILCTVRPRDTQPQDARTLQMHVFVMGPKIFEMNKFM